MFWMYLAGKRTWHPLLIPVCFRMAISLAKSRWCLPWESSLDHSIQILLGFPNMWKMYVRWMTQLAWLLLCSSRERWFLNGTTEKNNKCRNTQQMVTVVFWVCLLVDNYFCSLTAIRKQVAFPYQYFLLSYTPPSTTNL